MCIISVCVHWLVKSKYYYQIILIDIQWPVQLHRKFELVDRYALIGRNGVGAQYKVPILE